MSKAFNLSTIIRAFLGDADAGVTLVADALSASVVCMAVHGTRAPLDEAIKMVSDLKGKTAKERAMKAGASAIARDLKAIKVGRTAQADAQSLGEAIALAFVAGAGEVLTAPKVTYAKPAASDVAARAVKTLGALTDPQILAMLRTAAGQEMQTRFARVLAVAASADAIKTAARKVAPVAPVGDLVTQ